MEARKPVDENEVAQLADEFARNRKLLVALGDERRQELVLQMMRMGECSGVRVSEICEHSELSRPAISHHLQILKDAGFVRMRREGTRNYYYFDADTQAVDELVSLLEHARELMRTVQAARGF